MSRRTPGMGEKREREEGERAEGGEEKYCLVRGNKRRQETSAQSGRAVAGIYGNDRVLFHRHAEFSRHLEKFCIRYSLLLIYIDTDIDIDN